jgi:hypothetical protein
LRAGRFQIPQVALGPQLLVSLLSLEFKFCADCLGSVVWSAVLNCRYRPWPLLRADVSSHLKRRQPLLENVNKKKRQQKRKIQIFDRHLCAKMNFGGASSAPAAAAVPVNYVDHTRACFAKATTRELVGHQKEVRDELSKLKNI